MADRDRAITTVAREIVARLDLPQWEDYPDIGENDWERIVREVEVLIAGPTHEQYCDAYSFLSALADHGAREVGRAD